MNIKRTLVSLLTAGSIALGVGGAKASAQEWISNSQTGNEYKLTSAGTWLNAQTEAESEDGNLVSINDSTENQWLLDNFQAGGVTEGVYWIGLNDAFVEGQFEWVNGDQLNYVNWAGGEPNDAPGNGGEDYVGMFMKFNVNNQPPGVWNDWNVSQSSVKGIIERAKADENPLPDYFLKEGDSIGELLDSIEGSADFPVTIHLAPGIYEEDVEMDEWESIKGDNKRRSIIRGSIKAADNASVSNLTVKSPILYGENICVDVTGVSPSIYDNIIDGKGNRLSVGILVAGEGSNNAYIAGNEISRQGIGVQYVNSGAIVADNVIRDGEYGMWIVSPFNSSGALNGLVSGNKFKDNVLRNKVFIGKKPNERIDRNSRGRVDRNSRKRF